MFRSFSVTAYNPCVKYKGYHFTFVNVKQSVDHHLGRLRRIFSRRSHWMGDLDHLPPGIFYGLYNVFWKIPQIGGLPILYALIHNFLCYVCA
jgi:hypothetical protein